MLSWEKPFSRETGQWLMLKPVVSIEKWKFEIKKSQRKKGHYRTWGYKIIMWKFYGPLLNG